MKIINIYITINSKNTRRTSKKWGFVLEWNTKTKEHFGEAETTYNRATLTAINEALEKIKEPCEAHICIENGFIATMLEHNLDQWAGSGFRTVKGERIKNEEEWKKLYAMSQKHLIIMTVGRHSYSSWLEEEMKDV